MAEIKYRWNVCAVKTLIEEYQKREFLWNPSISEYKDRCKRREAQKEIAMLINVLTHSTDCTVKSVQKKWNGLRSSILQEKLKIQESSRSGVEGELYEPKIFWWKMIQFVNPVVTDDSESNLEDYLEMDISEEPEEENIATAFTEPQRKNRKKSDIDLDDITSTTAGLAEVSQVAHGVAGQNNDEVDVFTDYISSELKAIKAKSDRAFWQLKRRILVDVMEAMDEVSK